MEPKTPNKPGNLIAALLMTPLFALDTEDYFELAYEVDEFGVHAPYQSDDK